MIQLTNAAHRVLIVSAASGDVTPIVSPLRDAGCHVQLVETMDRAIQTARELNPTIVLVGGTQSDLSPLQISMRIREAVKPGLTPLFIITPTCEPNDCSTSSYGGAAPPPNALGGTESSETNPGVLAMVQQIGEALCNRESESIFPETGLPSSPLVDRIQCNGVCLDRERHRVWIDSEETHLTPTEFKLLWELVSRPGYVLKRDELALACRGGSGCLQSRTIDAHVKSIRRKLAEKSMLVETVHGIGYRFRDTEW